MVLAAWQQDLKWSRSTFAALVKPVLEAAFGGELWLIETTDRQSGAWVLDAYGGLDYVWRQGHTLYGVAARVQRILPGRTPYNTFTIRSRRYSSCATELEKMHNEGLRPTFTVQAYCTAGPETPQLLSVGLVRTEKLIRFIAENPDRVETRFTSNAEFLAVHFDDVQAWRWP